MNSYSPPKSVVADVAPPFGLPSGADYFKAWFCFALVSGLAGLVIGAVLGAIAGGILGAAGSSASTIGVAAAIAGGAGSLVFSYFIFRFFVRLFIVRKLVGMGGSGA